MSEQATQERPVEDDEISLIELATALGEEKKVIAKIAAGATALALVVSLLITPTFTARTLVIPPQQQQSAAASALASLGALAGMAGAAAGIKSSDEMYVAFLQSESLQDALIERFKLKERYDTDTLEDTRKKLKKNASVTSDKKTGLITIEVDDKDSQVAADMANAYVSELRTLLGRIAVTDAQQRRSFYEEQIKRTQQAQAQAEETFRQAKDKSGMQVTAVIAETDVKASAEMRAQIAAKEVQLEAMSRFATPQNPEYQRLSSAIAALRSQLNKLEQGTGTQDKYSATQHEAVAAYREIKAQEAMMTVLIAQYESARVDEAKEGPLVQQVDPALKPEKKSKPKRGLIVLLGALGGLLLGAMYAFVQRSLRRTKATPEAGQQLSALRAAWVWR